MWDAIPTQPQTEWILCSDEWQDIVTTHTHLNSTIYDMRTFSIVTYELSFILDLDLV